jgi:adenylate cyclase
VAEGRIQKRLAAVLAADVAGYSRLIMANGEVTLAAPITNHAGIIDPKIAERTRGSIGNHEFIFRLG